MLNIYLTDVQKHVEFKDYPGEHPVKFILSLKKIFPSVMGLLLPILPENENLDEMTWESTTADLETFKMLLSGWGVIELRLNAIAQYKTKAFADGLVKKAQQQVKDYKKSQPKFSAVDFDYLFMHDVNALIDAELIDLGEKFYLPTLREQWKSKVAMNVLNAKF